MSGVKVLKRHNYFSQKMRYLFQGDNCINRHPSYLAESNLRAEYTWFNGNYSEFLEALYRG